MAEPKVNYAPETCGFCSGSGRDSDYSHLKCEVCNGQGSILVAQPSKQCAFCGGSGRDKDYSHRKCDACNGTGWAHALVPESQHEDLLDDVLDIPRRLRVRRPFEEK